MGYGDDSIAQVGGAHVACEWVSNILTKVLQRGPPGRLPRAVHPLHPLRPATARVGLGRLRFYRDDELGPEYAEAMDELFSDLLARSLTEVTEWAGRKRWPRGDEPEAAWQRSIKAKALDLLARPLSRPSTLSHVGIFASGQAV
jgi:hypothetical protein